MQISFNRFASINHCRFGTETEGGNGSAANNRPMTEAELVAALTALMPQSPPPPPKVMGIPLDKRDASGVTEGGILIPTKAAVTRLTSPTSTPGSEFTRAVKLVVPGKTTKNDGSESKKQGKK